PHVDDRRATLFRHAPDISGSWRECNRARRWADVPDSVHEGAGDSRLPRVLHLRRSSRLSALVAQALRIRYLHQSRGRTALDRHCRTYTGRRRVHARRARTRARRLVLNRMNRTKNLAGKLLSLDGRVAMVSGAASGIGRGIALRLAQM